METVSKSKVSPIQENAVAQFTAANEIKETIRQNSEPHNESNNLIFTSQLHLLEPNDVIEAVNDTDTWTQVGDGN